MSFPLNPSDGQQTVQNGIAYVYSTATTAWRRTFNNVVDSFFIGASTQSTNTDNGALIVVGGVGIGRNLNVGENVVVYGTTQSTSSDTGSLVVKGGAAVGYDLNVGGGVRISSTEDSISNDSGALVVDGGAGIAKDVYIGGDLTVEGNLTAQATVDLNPNGYDVNLKPTGGGTVEIYPDDTGYIENMNIGLVEPASAKFTTAQIVNTSNSFNSTSGSLIVAGGVGVAKDLYVGGSIYSNGQIIGGPWYYTSTNYLAAVGDRLLLDTSATSLTVTLPASPIIGNYVEFIDYSGTFGINNMIFARNGQRIMGLNEDLIVNINYAANTLIYSGPNQGWKIGVIF